MRLVRSQAVATLVLAGLLLVGTEASGAGVTVVDQGGNGDYANLWLAIFESSPGDILLVKGGDYVDDGPLIVTHALTIIRDGSATARTAPISIHSLSDGSTVLLRGLEIDVPFYAAQSSSLVATQNEGSIRLEDCRLMGKRGESRVGSNVPGAPAAIVEASDHVSFSRCEFVGGEGVDASVYAPLGGDGGPGVRATDSTLSIHQCELVAGRGGDFEMSGEGSGGNGGHGFEAFGVKALVEATTLRGGDGGDGNDPESEVGSLGGDAWSLEGDSSVGRSRDNSFHPGGGGDYSDGRPAPDGEDVTVPEGEFHVYEGVGRMLTLSSPTRESETVRLSYAGEMGDLFALCASPSSGFTSRGIQGDWLTGYPMFGPFVLGTVGDPSGELILDLITPDLGLDSSQGLILFEQGIVLEPHGAVVLSSPSTHVIIGK